MRGWLRRIGTIAFVGASFLFLALAVARQRDQLSAFDWRIEPLRLGASVLALTAVLAGGVAIWSGVLRRFGVRVPFPALARIWFLSSLGRYIPGKIWQFVGVAELSRAAAVPALVGITSLLVYMGFVVLAAWMVSVYLLPASALGPFAAVAVPARAASPLLLLLLHPKVLGGVVGWAARLLRRSLAPWQGTWRGAVALLAACVVQWLGFGVAFFLFVSSLTSVTPAQLPALTGAFALAFLAGYVAFIAPAGLGAKDGALALLLTTALPFPIGVAAALSVAARVWSIAGDALPALLFLRALRSPAADATPTAKP